MNRHMMERGIAMFLKGMELDLTDQHLKRTPERVAKAWINTFGVGYSQNPKDILSVEFDEVCDEMVVVKNIPYISHCAHHLVPFIGTAKIGYVPSKKITGLSKLARILDMFAHRLQVQERLTRQVAETLQEHLKPLGVGVVLTGEHQCMTTRGVYKPGSLTVTSCLLGQMRTDSAMRQEFLDF